MVLPICLRLCLVVHCRRYHRRTYQDDCLLVVFRRVGWFRLSCGTFIIYSILLKKTKNRSILFLWSGIILILKISQSLICQIFSFVSTHFYMFSGRPCLLVVERIPFEYSHWSIVEFGCYRFGGIWSSSHDWWCHRLGCCHHLRSQTWSVLRRRWQSVRRTLGDRPPFCYAPILGYFLSLVRLVRIQPVSNTATSRSTKKTNEQILRVPFLFCFAFVQICF